MTISQKKIKTAFFCSQCGTEHPRWQGQCRDCGQWNSLIEERVVSKRNKSGPSSILQAKLLKEVESSYQSGLISGINEFDRVLGGRLLPGVGVLLGGEPGIGKSTLLLQIADAYSQQGISVLYVTGEESIEQLKVRAERLALSGDRVTVASLSAVADICRLIDETACGVVIVDSVQTTTSEMFDSPPGSVGQVREVAHRLVSHVRAKNIGLFLVGHVTKDGMVAGPKVLEHIVDTVLSFEGDHRHLYRLLRASKNRFGSINEIGLFEMTADGLKEVKNPSAMFLSGKTGRGDLPGTAVCAICEGSRPLLVEIQALVSSASYGTPQRVAGGLDPKRLALLLAVLEKRGGYPMNVNDVFVSLSGGMRFTEPAMDLAVVTAIVSSLLDRPVSGETVLVGEVGLSGEVRAVSSIDRRIVEAERLGFKRILIPAAGETQYADAKIEIISVAVLGDAIENSIA